MSSFGENLRKIRRQRSLTQDEMAELLETSKQVISRYENGQRSPKISVAAKFAELLGIPLSELSGEASVDTSSPANTRPVDSLVTLPVYGSIRCGPGGLAYQNIEERVLAANVKHPDECFYLRVEGDSMEPRISKGDLALIRKQEDVESGELAAVVIDGEEGTLKKVIKRDGSIILQSFNPDYPPRVFSGPELNEIRIVGKLIRTEREW